MIKIIAEIGINHSGSFNIAKQLIDNAIETKCWGVKFQYRDLSSFYSNTFEIGDEILISELDKTYLNDNEYKELIKYCKINKINVGLSFFRKEDAKKCSFIDKLDFLKVPSAEALNFDLIDYLLKKNKNVFISTGGHKNNQILEIISKYYNKLIYFHCVANYPVEIGNQNLNSIIWLQDQGLKNIGYSSHDLDFNICLIAITVGATWIERHLTIDKKGSGLDDSTSSDLKEFKIINRFAENFNNILGKKNKSINQGEILNMQNLGTSLYSTRDFDTGDLVDPKSFELLAPRKGLTTYDLSLLLKTNKLLKKPIKKGEPLLIDHLKNFNLSLKDSCVKICQKHKVAIPVRCHDYIFYKDEFRTNGYEFHLSFQEVKEKKYLSILKKIKNTENISIHLPDYLDNNRIFNPISSDKDSKNDSLKVLSDVVEFGNMISQKINKKVPIVGSFSEVEDYSEEEVVLKIKDLISSFGTNTYIYPQWLPGYAWYFGGSQKLNSFNSFKYVELINKYELNICLDISHLVLSANYRKKSWKDWYYLLKKRTKHIHLSDARGEYDEGIGINEGEFDLFGDAIKFKCMKVIEIWQGHLREGYGFKKEINKMDELN